MQNRFRKRADSAQMKTAFRGAAKNVSTPQGRYTMYALVICALLGILLSQVLPPLIQTLNNSASSREAADLATGIAFGISAVVLIFSLLKMSTIISMLQNRRTQAFEKRLEARKESDNADG